MTRLLSLGVGGEGAAAAVVIVAAGVVAAAAAAAAAAPKYVSYCQFFSDFSGKTYVSCACSGASLPAG